MMPNATRARHTSQAKRTKAGFASLIATTTAASPAVAWSGRAFVDFHNVWTALVPRKQVRMLQLLINKVVFDALDSSIEVSFYPSGVKALAGGAAEGPEAQA